MSTTEPDDGAFGRCAAINKLTQGIIAGTIDRDADYATKLPEYFHAKSPTSFAEAPTTHCSTSATADSDLPAAGCAGNGMAAACQRYCEHCKWEFYRPTDITCQRCAGPTVPALARLERLMRVCADKATFIGVCKMRQRQHTKWQADRDARDKSSATATDSSTGAGAGNSGSGGGGKKKTAPVAAALVS